MKKVPYLICLILFIVSCQKRNDEQLERKEPRVNVKINETTKRITKPRQMEDGSFFHEINIESPSTEGGVIWYYTKGNIPIKINVVFFGETGKIENIYYISDNTISKYETIYWHYNRPIYWDENKAKEMDDTEWFDIKKSMKEIDVFNIKEGAIEHIVKSENGKIDIDSILPKGNEYLKIVNTDIQSIQ